MLKGSKQRLYKILASLVVVECRTNVAADSGCRSATTLRRWTLGYAQNNKRVNVVKIEEELDKL